MLAWLGEWLSSIVAVILLAIVVELVLPNSKMLRYSRLVIGLILMLTMLNPVLQLFQTDFHEKLDTSLSLWEKELQGREARSPSLQQITKQAEQLIQQREAAALDVTKDSLELAMLQELKAKSSAVVEKVELEFGWEGQGGNGKEQLPHIASVHVYIKGNQQPVEEDLERLTSDVEEVSIPDLSIELDALEVDSSFIQNSDSGKQQGKELPTNEQLTIQANEIIKIITSSWSVKGDQIFVQAS